MVPQCQEGISTYPQTTPTSRPLFLWLQDGLRRFTPCVVPLVRVERGRVVRSDRKYGISKDAASPDRLMLRGEIHSTM
jgi:hypothetical protein